MGLVSCLGPKRTVSFVGAAGGIRPKSCDTQRAGVESCC